MSSEKHTNTNYPQEDSKWGLIVVIIFAVGLPLIGVIAKMLGY